MIPRCDCCDLPAFSCGKEAQVRVQAQWQREKDEEKAERLAERAAVVSLRKREKAERQHENEVRRIRTLVEERRDELFGLHAQITRSPASAAHRGTAGHRGHVNSPGVM